VFDPQRFGELKDDIPFSQHTCRPLAGGDPSFGFGCGSIVRRPLPAGGRNRGSGSLIPQTAGLVNCRGTKDVPSVWQTLAAGWAVPDCAGNGISRHISTRASVLLIWRADSANASVSHQTGEGISSQIGRVSAASGPCPYRQNQAGSRFHCGSCGHRENERGTNVVPAFFQDLLKVACLPYHCGAHHETVLADDHHTRL
jgi:hypothetical protein